MKTYRFVILTNGENIFSDDLFISKNDKITNLSQSSDFRLEFIE